MASLTQTATETTIKNQLVCFGTPQLLKNIVNTHNAYNIQLNSDYHQFYYNDPHPLSSPTQLSNHRPLQFVANLCNKLMKQAQRVYLKHKVHQQLHESPFFKSSVQRSLLQPLPNRDPGPGTYEVTFPLVKPKFQAIFKNNRSIIIKVNDIPVPAFASREARFRQYNTIDSKMDNDALDLRQLEKQSPNRIKNSRRYNFSMARKKSVESISFTTLLTNNQKNFDAEIVKKKGPEWSKYREPRKMWFQDSKNPGPGAYDGVEKIQKPAKKSWQFRSQTKRSYSEKVNNERNNVEIPEGQKIKSIHSRQNLLDIQY